MDTYIRISDIDIHKVFFCSVWLNCPWFLITWRDVRSSIRIESFDDDMKTVGDRVRASGIHGEEKVKFAYSINIRRVVMAAIPDGYWGNGCVPMYVVMSAKELIERPIWETAELIKKSKSNVSDEYVQSYIDYQELHFGDGITAGREVSGFTDWRHLGHSTVDFGWGGPVTVLPLGRNLLGSVEPCFFLPYSTASAHNKDGFKVLVTLRDSALPAFRQAMQLLSTTQHTSQDL